MMAKDVSTFTTIGRAVLVDGRMAGMGICRKATGGEARTNQQTMKGARGVTLGRADEKKLGRLIILQ